MTNEDLIFSCPCGVSLHADLPEIILHEQIKAHNPEHIERVLEIKSKTMSLPPIPYTPGQFTYVTSHTPEKNTK